MEGVVVKENTLLDSEKEFLNDFCLNFKATSTPKDNKHYFKQTILDYSKLSTFLKLSESEFEKFGFSNDKKLELDEVWINKVTNETNQKDVGHIDYNELTSVTFLNEDFEGGFLEINQENGKTEIEPKQNRTVFFQGSKLLHRVLPVKKGTRYTMVTFWKWLPKNQKTIL